MITAQRLVQRLATTSDAEFLQTLYTLTHGSELAALPLEPTMLAGLLRSQYQTRESAYRARHPASTDRVLLLDGAAVGRCWSDLGRDELRVLELAVLPSAQRRGVAGEAMRRLIGAAAQVGVPVRLSVWQQNVAGCLLYAGLGFQQVGAAGGYSELELSTPSPTAPGTGQANTRSPDEEGR